MMTLIARFLVTPITLFVVAAIFPGVIVESFYIALIVALLLAVINVTIRPVLLILTLPINILTIGLFTFVINALLLLFIATFVQGFAFLGFLDALLTALILTAANWAAGKIA